MITFNIADVIFTMSKMAQTPKSPSGYIRAEKKNKELIDMADKLKHTTLNFQNNQNNGNRFTQKIRSISQMIDFMAREKSKSRRSKSRHAQSSIR